MKDKTLLNKITIINLYLLIMKKALQLNYLKLDKPNILFQKLIYIKRNKILIFILLNIKIIRTSNILCLK